MTRRWTVAGTALMLGWALLMGCTGEKQELERCVLGKLEDCTCPDGNRGTQTCQASGSFGPCECTGSQDTSGGDDTGTPQDTASGQDTTVANDGADDTNTNTSEFEFRTDPPSAYTRVDRVGNPLVSSLLITSKDDYNETDPVDHDLFSPFVQEAVSNLEALHNALDVDLAGMGLTPCTVENGLGSCVTQGSGLVVPDTLKIDRANVAGWPNGRTLEDPVGNLMFAVTLLDFSVHDPLTFNEPTIDLHPTRNDLDFDANFPYLASFHR